jgi:hypothetical protein
MKQHDIPKSLADIRASIDHINDYLEEFMF